MIFTIPRGTQMTLALDNTIDNITIILEPSSSATIIYGSDPNARNAIIQRKIQCIVHDNATLTLRYNENWADDITAETDVNIEQKYSSAVCYTHSVRGGARIKQRFSLMASGTGAHATIRGSYELIGNGSVDMTTLQYHDAMHTMSNLLFKSIVRDAAHATHHGTIVITKNGAHTESAQHTHTLLLSDHARATSVPNIEVSTHEVKCGHGSAIGRLDEEQTWYLQSRGLSYSQAEQCLIDGFLKDVL